MALQTITDVKYDVRVKEMSKIEALKVELCRITGIRNKLRLLKNKEELDDGKLLRDYKIEDGTVIQMLIIPSETIEINVRVFKKGDVSLKVSDHNTVEDLRVKLAAEEYCLGSAPWIYDFFYNSEKLDNKKPLHFYGLYEGSKVDLCSLRAKLKLYLENAQQYKMVKILEFKGTDTIADVTGKVLKVIQQKEAAYVQNDDIVLFHRPRECSVTFNDLDCETSTLNEYFVDHFDRLIYIRYNSADMCHADIEYEGKQRRIYEVKNQESVISLKLKIQDQFGVPVGKQKLIIPEINGLSYGKKIPDLTNIRLERLQ